MEHEIFMGKRATMTDIADKAGVSQATVSLVLNSVPHARVSPTTRDRVLEAAEALGYRKGPRHIAPEDGVRVIGLLLDEVTTTPFAAQFIEGARDEAALHGCTVALFCTRGDPLLEAEALDALAKTRLAGVLYASLITRAVTLQERLAHVPTVLLNCHERGGLRASVVPGDIAGAFSATDALLRAGHRRIAHLAGESWIEAARDREKGYRRALSTWDVPADPDLIVAGGWTIDGGRLLADKLFALDDPPTAMFCFNDRMAIGAYDAIRARGLRVPDHVSVVGFDDEEIVKYLDPPLSTVVLPHDEMARLAVSTLLEQQADPMQRGSQVKVECQLVVRESLSPPRGTQVQEPVEMARQGS